MKSRLSKLLILTLVFTMLTPLFALAEETKSSGEILKDLGVIQGDGTSLMEDQQWNRQDLAVILSRLLGVEDEAKATAKSHTYADVTSSFYDGYLSWAKENGYMEGYTATEFGFGDKVTTQQFLAVMLRALGYDTAGANYSLVPGYAANLGLVAEGTEFGQAATRGTYYDVIVKTLGTEVKGEDQTLGAKLGLASFVPITVETINVVDATYFEVTFSDGVTVAYELDSALEKNVATDVTFDYNGVTYTESVTYVYLDLAIDSVSASNLKEVVVVYNKPVDETSAETLANYSTTVGGGIAKATLKDDARTVVLQLTNNATNQFEDTLTIKNVKDLDGNTIATTDVDYQFVDLAIPSAVSAELTAPNVITVTFSEPVNPAQVGTLTNYKIDSYQYSVSTAAVSASNIYKVNVTLGTSLPAGAHSITVNPTAGTLQDYATYKVPSTKLSFEAGTDTTVPTVEVKSSTETTVNLKFSEAVSGFAGNTNLYVRHTYNSNVYQVSGTSVTYDASKDEYVVNFGSTKAFPIGTVNLYIGYTSATGTLTEDLFGNELATTTLSFVNNVDTEKPEITSISFVDSTHLDVTYSEPVVGANLISNYTLKDSAGASLAITNVTNTTGNVYRLTTAQMSGGSYTLTVKNVKDGALSPNTILDTTSTISVDDAVKPTVVTASTFSGDQKKVVISFSEAMATSGSGSVLDLSLYAFYDGGVLTSWPTGTTITPGVGNKSVTISFPSAFTNLTAGDTVVVGRVADVAGNYTAALSSTTTLAGDSLTGASIANVKAINTTTVTFDVNTPLSAIDIADFTSLNGNTVVSASYVNQDVTISGSTVSGSTVTVKVASGDKWATNAAGITVVMANGAITSSLGTALTGPVTTAAAADYMAPAISTITTKDADSDGKLDKVEVVYTENLNATSVDFNDFTVEGYTVSDVTFDGTTMVTLTLTEVGYDTGVTPVVTQVGEISDASAQKNVLAAGATKTTVDGAAPVLVDAIISVPGLTAGYGNNANDVIQLIFSENIVAKTGFAVADAELDFDATNELTGDKFTGDSISIVGNTMTFTSDAGPATDVIIVGNTINKGAGFVGNDIEDAAGNDLGAHAVTVR